MDMHRILLAVVLMIPAALAQKFDVASIKPNKSDDHRMMFAMQPGGRFNATGVTLKRLMVFAYGIREYQLTGLPAWADSDRYDVMAKPEGAPDAEPTPDKMPSPAEMQTRQEKMRAMLQDLLADRFGLKVHRETKDLPVYNLVVAKGGSKLSESKPDAPNIVDVPGVKLGGGPGGEGGRGPVRGAMIRMGRGQITGQQMSIAMLVNQLSAQTGRNVIDKTGLTGLYDIKLSWTPEEGQMMIPKDGGAEPAAATGDTGPSLFTAVQEQLGLKLEPAKGPVEIIVVDRVEKPTEN